jgi:hypothetical protein
MNNFIVLKKIKIKIKKDLTNDDLGCIIKTQQNERGNTNDS